MNKQSLTAQQVPVLGGSGSSPWSDTLSWHHHLAVPEEPVPRHTTRGSGLPGKQHSLTLPD
jgi:hypothetical protein